MKILNILLKLESCLRNIIKILKMRILINKEHQYKI